MRIDITDEADYLLKVAVPKMSGGMTLDRGGSAFAIVGVGRVSRDRGF